MIRTILKTLMKSTAYPEPTTRVEMMQTHVSWLFLTDTHVYKIKKPVDFGFLNFSTIDRRRFYCNEEVKYNRRLCPDIYEGVVELRESEGGAAFHGNGAIIDYAVKMRRLPAEGMLDRLVANNSVTLMDIRNIASHIAEFHQNAATSAAIADHGTVDRIMFNWQENFDQMTAFSERTLPAAELELIRNWVISFAHDNGALFDQRVSEGFVRECDGDIHLENICLFDSKVYIFDCIEFSDRLRCCDTAADLAFLLMDLDFHNRLDLSREALSAYQEITHDTGMAPLLAFYKSYRAFVRGKVASFRLNDSGIDLLEQEKAVEKARRYFRLARGYTEQNRLRTTLFITCGLMGCGKSVIAEQLAFELGITCFSSDRIRKSLAGLQPDARVAEAFQEGLYAPQASQATYDELRRLATEELAAGRSAVIDACFSRSEDRRLCSKIAQEHGARFVILHVSCSESENRRRLVERSKAENSISDGRVELLASQTSQFEPPSDDEGVLIRLHATAAPISAVDAIYERLD